MLPPSPVLLLLSPLPPPLLLPLRRPRRLLPPLLLLLPSLLVTVSLPLLLPRSVPRSLVLTSPQSSVLAPMDASLPRTLRMPSPAVPALPRRLPPPSPLGLLPLVSFLLLQWPAPLPRRPSWIFPPSLALVSSAVLPSTMSRPPLERPSPSVRLPPVVPSLWRCPRDLFPSPVCSVLSPITWLPLSLLLSSVPRGTSAWTSSTHCTEV
mmetsp:Transcript_24096/g.69262  ORF Transcript_24096/g.69262 Transcript_24096/m.69262 type:complete len:208 (+) Transcript_24096:1157-1780(+)